MSRSRDTLCITCGQAVAQPPRFNLLASGEHCPTCRDRVLDAVPPLLPRSARESQEREAVRQMDFSFDDADEPSDWPDPPRSA